MLNNSAVQKLETLKPSINLSAIKIIIAFITNKNKPKVIMVTGIVRTPKWVLKRCLTTLKQRLQ